MLFRSAISNGFLTTSIDSSGNATFAGRVTATGSGGLTLSGGGSVIAGTGLITLVRNSVISWNANSSTQDQYIYADSSSNLKFGTGNTLALTLDSSQNATFAGKVTATGGIVGTTTNNNAAAGCVGEYVSSTVASGSAVSLTTGTGANVTSISLTAGDWDVSGVTLFQTNASATPTLLVGSANTTSATLGADETRNQQTSSGFPSNAQQGLPIPVQRISITANTTVYLVAYSAFTAGSVTAFGKIQARRVR